MNRDFFFLLFTIVPGLFGYSVTPSHILNVILIQNTSKIAYFIEDISSYLDQFALYINDLTNQ